MNPVLKTKYFTFQEVLNLYPERAPRFPHDTQLANDWFTKMLEDADLEPAVYTLSEFFTDDLINEIINALITIVYYRHDEDYFYEVTTSVCENYQMSQSDFRKAIKKLMNVLDLTLPKYIPMLQQNEWASTCPITPNVDESTEESSGDNHATYEGENTSNSNGQNRTNDTPQDSGDFSDDAHTSNVVDMVNSISNEASSQNDGDFSSKTKKSNSTNIGTLMARLTEMYDNFKSIILEWSNEFNQLFLKEEQL